VCAGSGKEWATVKSILIALAFFFKYIYIFFFFLPFQADKTRKLNCRVRDDGNESALQHEHER